MIQVFVVETQPGLASSFAITGDVLATANQVLERTGRPAAFAVTTIPGHRRAVWDGSFGRDDVLIVPGLGISSAGGLVAALDTVPVRRLAGLMFRAAESEAIVAASCSSTFLLAQTGLLNEKTATTTWWLAPAFARRYPLVTLKADQMVVDEGRLLTAGAAMAQVDLMLRLVTRLAGPELADTCSRYLLLDTRQSQTPYTALSTLVAADAKLVAAEGWVRENIGRDFSIDEVAAAIGLAPRTFSRRLIAACGASPSKFVQRIRVETAVTLLCRTGLSVEEISAKVGYADASTLRRILKRETGKTASEIRRPRVDENAAHP